MNRKFVDVFIYVWSGLVGAFMLAPSQAYAFTKLKHGFEIITTTYLMPLSQAVAGAAFIYYITVSYFQQEKQKQAGQVLILCLLGAGGLDLITKIMQSFS